jgi:two-component system, sensor histidine kinase RegB
MNVPPPTQARLRRLYRLRWCAITVQSIAILSSKWGLDADLPMATLFALLALLFLINGLTAFRLRISRDASDWEFAAHLSIDMTGLALLLYFTGGATNPFISLLLLPLAIGAASLQWRQVLPLTLYSVIAYSVLMFNFEPFMLPEGTLPYDLHLVGMWVTYTLCATLIAWYVTRITIELRRRDGELAAVRESELRNQQILALGTLATGAAHELGTPLSTIAVLVPELERSCARSPDDKEDFALLRSQVAVCRNILTDLLARTGRARSEGGKPTAVDKMLGEVVGKWRLLKPDIKSSVVIDEASPTLNILSDGAIRQALLNLLNNAADASPERVDVHIKWDRRLMTVTIEDDGPGLDEESATQIGQPFFTKRDDGMGLGIFLAQATLHRFGGRVTFANRAEGGLTTTVKLPLDALVVSEELV